MTGLEKIVQVFGSQQNLAIVIGMTRGRVSQWLQPHKHHRDTLPPRFNDAVRDYAKIHFSEEDRQAIEQSLEDACPYCHRPY